MTEEDTEEREGETVAVVDDRLDSSGPDHEIPEPRYRDGEWLYQQYAVLAKTEEEIADECSVWPKTISRWLDNHGIETRPGGPRPGPWKNGEWLRTKYHEQGKTVEQIANEHDCDEKTIRAWLAEHGIETRDHSERHPASRSDPPYRDKEWLQSQYVDQGKSSDQIAEACGVEPATILEWLDRHGIDRRTVAESRQITESRPTRGTDEESESSETVQRKVGRRRYRGEATGIDLSEQHISERGEREESPYRDEQWLRDALENRSIAEIAEFCRVEGRTIRYWMEKHGLETPNPPDEAEYSISDIHAAIRQCAESEGEPVSHDDYKHWATGRDDIPSAGTIRNRLAELETGWREIVEDAGVEPPEDKLWSENVILRSVAEFLEQRDDHSLRAYRDWAGNRSAPSKSKIYQEVGSWTDAKMRARELL